MRRVIIFAGTTEGRKLSEYLAVRKVPVTACVATEYGETLLTANGIPEGACRTDGRGSHGAVF